MQSCLQGSSKSDRQDRVEDKVTDRARQRNRGEKKREGEKTNLLNSRHIRQPPAELFFRILVFILFLSFREIFFNMVSVLPSFLTFHLFPFDLVTQACLSLFFFFSATGRIFRLLHSSINILYMLGYVPAQMFLLGCTGVSELYPAVYSVHIQKLRRSLILFMEVIIFLIGLEVCSRRFPEP